MNNNDKNNKHIKINPLAAGVAGAVVGAGAAVATAQVLKEEKTRKKIKAVLENAKDQTLEYVKKASKSGGMQKDIKKAKKITKKAKNTAVKTKKLLK